MEGELRRALGRARTATAGSEVELEVASRTDRGVSARANALTVRSPLPGPSLLRQLNGADPDVYFTAAAPVPDDFRVRRAVRRTYRYFDAVPTHDLPRQREAAALFAGRVDVRSFGRGVPPAAPVWRPVESVTVREVPGGTVVEVRAPSFVWGMVRKVIAALREVDAGRLPLPRLHAALAGAARLSLPLAEPEALILWEVEHGVPWTVLWAGPNRAQATAELRRRQGGWVRARLLEVLGSLRVDPDA
ncbi:MAG: hypothetical protein ACRECT_05790 [Thermoplasmata archaeon]